MNTYNQPKNARTPQNNANHRASTDSSNKNKPDEVGHYVVVPGRGIDNAPPFPKGRYTIIRLLGSGTYGKVVLCEDNKYNKALVAVKLVRNTPHLYRLAAKNEIKILRDLDGRNCTVKILRDFEFQVMI
jgi:serine/threonine protein kinase